MFHCVQTPTNERVTELTDLVLSKESISSKEGIGLKICKVLGAESPSDFDFTTLSFSFESIGTERASSAIESGRKILMYTAAITATEAAT